MQYSEKLSKLFVRFDAFCPFYFTSLPSTPRGCVLRATPKFVRPQNAHEVVRRCPHHAGQPPSCVGDRAPPADHLIRCDHKLAEYREDPATGFHSVVVPYDVPSGGNGVFVACDTAVRRVTALVLEASFFRYTPPPRFTSLNTIILH